MTDTKKYEVLCQLDRETQLCASSECFVLLKQHNDELRPVYYYSELGDALRGYARNLLKDKDKIKNLDGKVASLMQLVKSLETKISDVGETLQEHWDNRSNDPIEKATLSK